MHKVRTQTTITTQAALELVTEAIAAGAERGVAVSVAVVDASMSLVAFAKADGATAHSVETSRRKANTAASTRRATGWMGPDLDPGLALGTGMSLTNIRGGLPVGFEAVHVGGLGIAGGTPAEDTEIAAVALARVGADMVQEA
jgi:uncharacterized protein GlcG (DUF336 family)